MICQLTAMDVSNASVYDGATAAAEAAAMCRDRRRTVTYASAACRPMTLRVLETYCFSAGTPLVLIPEKEGRTDLEALKELMDPAAPPVFIWSSPTSTASWRKWKKLPGRSPGGSQIHCRV